MIGGAFKGRKLSQIKGESIRPTLDKTKEAIFSIIGSDIRGKKVLDLFAGTGALGIEAISRGAEFSVFIDNDDYALSIIKKNIKLCSIEKKTKVIKTNIIENPYFITHKEYDFEIVFMDPPYNDHALIASIENLNGIIINNESKITIIAEHSILSKIPEKISDFSLYDQRKYGKTLVSFLKN